ncbi:hypothetical protein D3C75_733250 [compost metagenome]
MKELPSACTLNHVAPQLRNLFLIQRSAAKHGLIPVIQNCNGSVGIIGIVLKQGHEILCIYIHHESGDRTASFVKSYDGHHLFGRIPGKRERQGSWNEHAVIRGNRVPQTLNDVLIVESSRII